MKFTVTQKMINEGHKADCWDCPVALAIKAKFPTKYVLVDSYQARISDELYVLPQTASRFIRNFDRGYDCRPHPFFFSLDIEK